MTAAEACGFLKQQQDVLILCHQNPDGDTLGCGFGLYYALEQLGVRARVDCSDPIPPQFDYLLPASMPELAPRCVVAVDVADTQLLGKRLSCWAEKIDLCIDHHPSNKMYAARTLLRPEAPAAAQIMLEVIEGLGAQITPKIADCIYTGLCTDTGCFQFSNVKPDTLRMAAKLMELGAQAYPINRRMFGVKSKARIAMEREVLDSLTYRREGKVAVIAMTAEMFARTGAVESELDGLANIPRQIEGVEVGVTLREKPGGFKISLRTAEAVDASKICGTLGGGGHARAAGCFVSGGLEEAKEKILAAVEAACEEAGL